MPEWNTRKPSEKWRVNHIKLCIEKCGVIEFSYYLFVVTSG